MKNENSTEETTLESILQFIDEEDNTTIYSGDDNDEPTPVKSPIIPEEEEDEEEDEGTPTPKEEEKPLKIDPKPVEKDSKKEESKETEGQDQTLHNYYNLLEEEGLLFTDKEFTFDGTTESLSTALEQTKANLKEGIAKQLWDALPEDFKPLLNYGLSGGKDLKKYLDTFKSRTLEDLDVEKVNDQKQILRQYYQEIHDYPDDKINRFIDKLDKMDSLEEEAASALVELKEIEAEKRNNLVAQETAARKAAEDAAKKDREQVIGILEGDESLTPKQKNSLKAFFFNPIKMGEEIDTELNRNLKNIGANKEHWVQLGKIIAENYDPKKGFTLTEIKKRADSAATKNLKSKLDSVFSSGKSLVSGTNSKTTTDNQTPDWEAWFNQ